MHAHACTYMHIQPPTHRTGRQAEAMCVLTKAWNDLFKSREASSQTQIALSQHATDIWGRALTLHGLSYRLLLKNTNSSQPNSQWGWVMCAVCVCVSVDVCLKQKLSSLAIGPKANWYTARSAHRNHTTYTQPTDEDMHQISHSIGPVCLYCGHTLHSWKRWGVLATSWLHY